MEAGTVSDVRHPTAREVNAQRARQARLVSYVPTPNHFDRLRDLIGARERAYHIMKLAHAHTPVDLDYIGRREADWAEAVRAVEEVISKLQCGVPQ